jgi:hypothetical protein
LAAINHQPEELLADNDTVVQWAQEVYSRAYALHVLARWEARFRYILDMNAQS